MDRAKLTRSNLKEAELSEIFFPNNLTAKYLKGTILTGANLSEMTFTVADLTNSILDDSDLCYVDLSCPGFLKARLIGSCFKVFILEEANISLAILS
jgi:uncharacterized protein YjbI with pentapeptide repeats